MPKGKTRKFIDKKDSVTFHLVHRSQKDPLVADETAPQRVLLPASDTQAAKVKRKETEKRKEEQQKYGIYFDDDYNYLQHLRDVNTLSVDWEPVTNRPQKDNDDAPKINLPSSVFGSNVEEKVGLLNKAAPVSGPQLDLDPDVVAAMDDDFDFDNPDNFLEDNFIELANVASDSEEDSNSEHEYESDKELSSMDSEFYEEEEADEVCSLQGSQYTFKDEETKSRFTEYSMSSSVMRRNEQLTLLDDKFEQMYATYDEIEIGALDNDEIEGHVTSDSNVIISCAAEFAKERTKEMANVTELMKDRLKIIEKEGSSSEDEKNLEELIVDAREKDKWDCQSIISTYSNIYNHPKVISEPKPLKKIELDRRTGIPKNTLGHPSGKLTVEMLNQFNLKNNALEQKYDEQSVAESRRSRLSTLSVRPKGESSQQRRTRKQLLKEFRKERRVERKANTEAFKEEKKRQEKIRLNNRSAQHICVRVL